MSDNNACTQILKRNVHVPRYTVEITSETIDVTTELFTQKVQAIEVILSVVNLYSVYIVHFFMKLQHDTQLIVSQIVNHLENTL